jgi:hypothetical protein
VTYGRSLSANLPVLVPFLLGGLLGDLVVMRVATSRLVPTDDMACDASGTELFDH